MDQLLGNHRKHDNDIKTGRFPLNSKFNYEQRGFDLRSPGQSNIQTGLPKCDQMLLQAASGEPHELARLDEMHIGISSYFSDELALTPIGDPKRILEVGYVANTHPRCLY